MIKILKISTLIGFVFSLAACSASSSDAEASKVAAEHAKIVSTAALGDLSKTVFADTVAINHDFPTPKITADFNGDGQMDTLWVVTQLTPELPKGIKLFQPWPNYAATPPPAEITAGSTVRLAIIHAGNPQGFLLRDINSISVLDTEAAQELTVISAGDIADLEEAELAAEAKGDIIVIPTEAGIDNYLYWDGSAYRLYEVMDIP